MTKTKRAVKEVNKMADREILKSQIAGQIVKCKQWLNVEVYGYKRAKILLATIIIVVAVFTV
jgi:hypothetical protein